MRKILAILLFLAFDAHALTYDDLSAEEQKQVLWRDIEKTVYPKLPPFVAPGIIDTFTILRPSFNKGAFDDFNCVMREDRKKIVHPLGVVAQVQFIVRHQIGSGMLIHGADHGLMRISLAKAPENGNYTPGLALMLFKDNQPPANILAMPSIDGQNNFRLFDRDYVTSLPTPSLSFKTWVLSRQFNEGIKSLGYKNHDALALSTSKLLDEHDESNFKIRLTALPALKNLFKAEKSNEDFREILVNAKLKDEDLFLVHVEREDQPMFWVGVIRASSNFLASKFADERLHFQHQKPLVKKGKKRCCPCF